MFPAGVPDAGSNSGGTQTCRTTGAAGEGDAVGRAVLVGDGKLAASVSSAGYGAGSGEAAWLQAVPRITSRIKIALSFMPQ
jgi:hypothetical protein